MAVQNMNLLHLDAQLQFDGVGALFIDDIPNYISANDFKVQTNGWTGVPAATDEKVLILSGGADTVNTSNTNLKVIFALNAESLTLQGSHAEFVATDASSGVSINAAATTGEVEIALDGSGDSATLGSNVNDTLVGYAGNETLNGGTGAGQYIYDLGGSANITLGAANQVAQSVGYATMSDGGQSGGQLISLGHSVFNVSGSGTQVTAGGNGNSVENISGANDVINTGPGDVVNLAAAAVNPTIVEGAGSATVKVASGMVSNFTFEGSPTAYGNVWLSNPAEISNYATITPLATGGDQITFLTVGQVINITNAVVHFADGVAVSIDGPAPTTNLVGVATHDATHHHG
jgi:hypothetical protein